MKLNKTDITTMVHPEPSLEFAFGRLHKSPRWGITAFGPRTFEQSNRHPKTIRLGFIGSGESTGSARKWIESCIVGVSGEGEYDDFPGFTAEQGFYSQILMEDAWYEQITMQEIREVANPRLRRDRFELALKLLDDKLRLLGERDNHLDCIVLALPDELLNHCKTVNYMVAKVGEVHRDFRRALKSAAMKYRLPTQILLQRTSEAKPTSRHVDHKSRCAWNFFTSLYFKAGGIPWSPHNLAAGTCHIGISFHRKATSEEHSYFTSTAQAFDEHGEGLVLRGQDFSWDAKKSGPSPHLSRELAGELMELTLERYRAEMKQQPSRVVVHKSSQFWPDERAGFEEGLSGVHSYDLLSVNPVSDMRLLRDGQYPVLRGTHVQLGEKHLLYTTGYIPSLNAYPHGHVPSPLMVYDHHGDTELPRLLDEILILTKMNWNMAGFAGLLPITVRFSRVVGEIMTEVPSERSPLPQFKFYM